MTPLFNILIASVYSRTGQLHELLDHLTAQTFPYQGAVRVLVDRDDCVAPVGVKRTRLVEAANATYVSFVDDDDWVSDDYVARIMGALAERPDAVGFTLAYSHNGVSGKNAYHSSRYSGWDEDEFGFYRTINHLNPVRRELALQCLPFLDGFGEDVEYAGKLAPLIRSEVFLDEPVVYDYRWSSTGSLFVCPGDPARRLGHEPPLRSFPFVTVLEREESVAA